MSTPPKPTLLLPEVECRLRIIAVNDVYKLENFPSLRNLIADQSVGQENVITTLAGDFLAPSLLSSIDQGRGMIGVMNALPVDMVCFGNHESDVPYESLCRRIDEFNGVWLNSNMPTLGNKRCPESYVKELIASDGSKLPVAFLGFLIGGGKFAATYRDGAFGGHAEKIVPVLESAPQVVERVRAAHPDLLPLGIIPLTHQDEDEDVEMARSGLFPVIVGGHDHQVIHKKVPTAPNVADAEKDRVRGGSDVGSDGSRQCPVVKAGMDAEAAYVIDLVWHTLPGSTKRYSEPTVSATLIPVDAYEVSGLQV
jgi:2',3'-cyclic-nucleotide 2'-phosphodiesterase (5'-nucleotidase family)